MGWRVDRRYSAIGSSKVAMDCREFLKLHSEFLDERLARSDADRCEAHAATCASCARYDRVVRRGQELLRRLPATPVSPDFRTRLEQRVLQGRDEVFAEHAASTGAVVSLAIAGLLALAAWGPMLRSSHGGPELVGDEQARDSADGVEMVGVSAYSKRPSRLLTLSAPKTRIGSLTPARLSTMPSSISAQASIVAPACSSDRPTRSEP